MSSLPLPHKAVLFIAELLANPEMNQTDAALKAGYAPRSAHVAASRWMGDPRVIEALKARNAERIERLAMTADDVIRDIFHLATADNNELSQYRVGCCRYCHGDNFGYQRTPAQYRNDLARYLANEESRKLRPHERHEDRDMLGLRFDHAGGVGFDVRKAPHPDCPECFGEGVGREILQDTRNLAPAARKLYAGVKRTKNGVEMMTRSQDKALDLAARHTGVVKAAVELTGKNGGPVQHAAAVVALSTSDPIEAAREYQKLMGG